ncbi:hypothetical protein ACEPAF_8049 [Sanghuangporus sanghuang]
MSRIVRGPVAVLIGAAALVSAQQSTYPATPLASKHYAYPSEIPYKVDTDTNLIRGEQYGYNICNSTTEGQDSLCQTSFLNHLDDFCLWAPPEADSLIADTEGEEVAWCTKPGKGTRIIPPGALKGVQYMRTPDYVQVVGFVDQTLINIQSGDYGGELDPHGADLRGNPMGGLVYSNAFNASNGDNDTYTQAIEWHNFMGSDTFCFKVCDPEGSSASEYCQHTLDRIGCAYNAPNNAQNGTFEACLGDNQDPPGVYTSDGQVLTYSQPAESLGEITTIPYTPVVPASSSCTSFASAELYASAASWYSENVSSVAISGSAAASGTSGSATRTSSSSGASASSTGESSGSLIAARSMLAGENGAGAAAAIAFMGMFTAAALIIA